MSHATDWSIEEERIRAAYARRDARATERAAPLSAGDRYTLETRARRVGELLGRHGIARLERQRILDVGCGTGSWLEAFVTWGADPRKIAGIDLVPARVEEARRRAPAPVTVLCGNAASLPYPAASFDVVVQATAFTSVLDGDLRRRIASEMVRVLADDGLIVWYDIHVGNPWNRDVRGVTLREIRQLFPDCEVTVAPITLALPVARVVARWSAAMCAALETVPALCTHYLGAIRRTTSAV